MGTVHNRFALISFTLCLLISIADSSSAETAAPQEQGASSEWRLIGNNPEQHHFSSLDQINDKSVKRLGLAWSTDMPTLDGPVGVPLVADGVIYQSLALGKVFAHDVVTGKEIWNFDAKIQFPLGVVPAWGARLTRGLALIGDLVITAVGDCRLIALDKATGEQHWVSQACDPELGYTITGAPRVGAGKVFIGNANADSGATRGYVSAFDVKTGEMLWRFYTVPSDPALGFENDAMEMASKTWGKEYWKLVGGGSAWDAMTYDPVLDLLYIGTDAPSPVSPLLRGEGAGDELFTNAIVALDASTGDYRWHYSTTPGDGWNYGATMHIMIAELDFGGQPRRVVMSAPKNGFFYILDASNGDLISAENIVPINWASHIDMKTGRPVKLPDSKWWLKGEEGALTYPSPLGAHNWMPMSYSKVTGLIYIPVMESPMTMIQKDGNLIGGVDVDFYYGLDNDAEFSGSLLAWDPVQQKQRWKTTVGRPYQGGILSTAGNLVFQGSSEGKFSAYNAESGENLWAMFVGSGILAAPVTVDVDGNQLIILPVGSGMSASIGTYPEMAGNPGGPARLLAFRLDGKAELSLDNTDVVAVPKPPRSRPLAENVAKGENIWLINGCELCHGFRVIGSQNVSVPDLRYANAKTHDDFAAIMSGTRWNKGMPTFNHLSSEEMSRLQDYILAQAWLAYDGR
ncbi:MAG: PQQ-dependent dehydrogenase, methanol/ethanol family [Halioglobus sp.]